MERRETRRLILRGFRSQDWPEVQALAIDWKSAPGPEFDKLPTTETECRQFTDHLSGNDRYYAVCLRGEDKVIGLLALNGYDEQKRLDLGHIILSSYQDNDHDREALAAIVAVIFGDASVSTIVTHNADHPPQLAALRSLGFRDGSTETGELVLGRAEWERSRAKGAA